MSTQPSTITYLLDQLAELPGVTARKMFGEYALYCDEKVVALVCDDRLFVKISPAGKIFVGEFYEEAPAYKGAKPSMLIPEEKIEDAEWLLQLIRITAENVLLPVKRKKVLKNKKF